MSNTEAIVYHWTIVRNSACSVLLVDLFIPVLYGFRETFLTVPKIMLLGSWKEYDFSISAYHNIAKYTPADNKTINVCEEIFLICKPAKDEMWYGNWTCLNFPRGFQYDWITNMQVVVFVWTGDRFENRNKLWRSMTHTSLILLR